LWPDLESLCKAREWPLIAVSLENESPSQLPLPNAPHEAGGHILLTSGTTGKYKMVLNTPAIEAEILKQKAEVVGMNQDTVFSVFDFGPWTGPGYKWAAAPWLAGGTTVIDQGREHYLRC